MKKTLLAIALFSSAIAGQQARAASHSLVGQTVEAYIGTVIAPVERIDDLGVYAPFAVQEGLGDLIDFGGVFSLDVNGDGFNVSFNEVGSWGSNIGLHLEGLAFVDGQGQVLGGIPYLELVSSFDHLDVAWTGSSLVLDMSNLSVTPQSYISGRFMVSSVPEPNAMLISAMGMIAMAAVFRKYANKVH